MSTTGPGSILTMPDTPEGSHDIVDPFTAALDDRQTALDVRPDLPALMTTQEVAKYLRVTDATVRTYAERGTLPGYRVQAADSDHPRNTRLRFKREDVLAFLAGRPAALGCGCTGQLPDA